MILIKEITPMNKGYIPTVQDFKTVGNELIRDYEQNIKQVNDEIYEQLCSFPEIDVDNYISQCVNARQTVFKMLLEKHNALQWLITQQGFKHSFDKTLDVYLRGNTKERVIKRLTQDIQNYYRLFPDEADTELDMDIYQLKQKYKNKSICYIPYQKGCYTNGKHAGLSYSLQFKRFFELIRDLCIFYGYWLDGLYIRKAEYIRSGLNDLKKNLEKIHLIINKLDFVDCFPKDLLPNILPSLDIKQNHIEKNSINYLENLINQHNKIGLRNDEYLERRLKIYDLVKIIMKWSGKQLTRAKLDRIMYEMMTIPIGAIDSVDVTLTEKTIRDLLGEKKLNIVLDQEIREYISPHPDDYEGHDNYMEKLIEANGGYEEYLRVVSEDD